MFIFSNFGALCRMVKIEHSVFALPFAFLGLLTASGGRPEIPTLIFLVAAMVSVRSFAMAFNRIADLRYDRLNPRTAGRHLVVGQITPRQAWFFCGIMALIFVLACAGLNMFCLKLSPVALALGAGYSYTKRFTWLSHFVLGAVLGLAPLAGWLSVRESVDLTPALFFWAVLFWTAGFDILYACQDVDFDRAQGLHSVPARFGAECALRLAAFCQVNAALLLFLGGWSAGFSIYWYPFYLAVCGILYWEQRLISPGDLSRLDLAFFTLNGAVSVIIFAGAMFGIYL